jgi:hypothetical protein
MIVISQFEFLDEHSLPGEYR